MLRKLTLALVAAASLSAMALAPSTASAGGVFWPKYPHHHHHHWGHGHGFGHDDLPALGGAILGLEHSCIRQDCSNHECSYNLGLVDRHLCHQAGT